MQNLHGCGKSLGRVGVIHVYSVFNDRLFVLFGHEMLEQRNHTRWRISRLNQRVKSQPVSFGLKLHSVGTRYSNLCNLCQYHRRGGSS